MWDATTQITIGALDGLARRQETRAHNVANAETPGFRAQHVDFEANLRDALRRGDPPRPTTATPSPTVIDHTGNSVELETELIGAMRDSLQHNAAISAFNFKTGQLRAAIGGQR